MQVWVGMPVTVGRRVRTSPDCSPSWERKMQRRGRLVAMRMVAIEVTPAPTGGGLVVRQLM
jgi:hypothetical protein